MCFCNTIDNKVENSLNRKQNIPDMERVKENNDIKNIESLNKTETDSYFVINFNGPPKKYFPLPYQKRYP